MKKFTILSLFAFLISSLSIQAQIDIVSVGPGYNQGCFYNISTGAWQTISHDNWDIAFAVQGNDVGIFVNEGVATSQSEELPQVELYSSTNMDFNSATFQDAGDRLLNPDQSWATGAFNTEAGSMGPFDFGWGIYDPVTHVVTGNRVFLIKLRDGTIKKVQIMDLTAGVYTFKYANEDGSDEQTQECYQSLYSDDSTLAYFRFSDGVFGNYDPASWDILFNRYSTLAENPDGSGEVLEYVVTGGLSNRGVLMAQADEIDPDNVDSQDYEDAYSEDISVLGHDWKAFNLGTFMWELPTDRVYFVKTNYGELWKIQMIDFEGSATGNITIKKEWLATINTKDVFESLVSFNVFPNPASNLINVAFEMDTAADGQVQIVNNLGQTVLAEATNVQTGLNVKSIDLDLPSGLYYVNFTVGNNSISRPFLVR